MQRSQTMRFVYDKWQASGINRHAFCKQEQINYASFNYWYKQFKDFESVSGFSEVILNKPEAPFSELVFPSGARMIFHGEPSLTWLKELLY